MIPVVTQFQQQLKQRIVEFSIMESSFCFGFILFGEHFQCMHLGVACKQKVLDIRRRAC